MKRIIAIIIALFGMVLGLAMVLPALGQWARTGVLHGVSLAMGTTLVIAFGLASFYGIKTYKEARGRQLLALAVLGVGVFYALPLIMAFFQSRKTDLAGWLFCAALAAASAIFFGSCLYFNKRNSPRTAG
jgi:uncharacterized protein with PQ loop repeat